MATVVNKSGTSQFPPDRTNPPRNTSLFAGVDRSGTIITGGVAQQLAAANANRTRLTGQNTSAGDIWINEIGGVAAIDAEGSYKVVSGNVFSTSTNRAISVIGATTGQRYTATEV